MKQVFQQLKRTTHNFQTYGRGFTQHHPAFCLKRHVAYQKGGAGFTLVEVMVTVGIFGLAFVTIGAIFLGFTISQARATQAQRLLNEGNYIFDSVVREIRMNAIDYSCTATSYATETDYICLQSLDGKSIHFRITDAGTTKRIEVCKMQTYDEPACADASENWSIMTPDFMKVIDVQFYVSPTQSPYETDDIIYAYHPITIVRMVIESGRGRARQVYRFQTAVSSRVYNF